MLGFYRMSLIGRSHVKSDIVCQDANEVKLLDNGWIIAAAADGLGGSEHSEVAAQTAVQKIVEYFADNLQTEWNTTILEDMMKNAFRSAYQSIMELISNSSPLSAYPNNMELIDNSTFSSSYQTTLMGVIYNGEKAVFGSVGDGGIISLYSDGEFLVENTQNKGDVFNQTIPINAGEEQWSFGHSDESRTVASLLIMTDGLFDVAHPHYLFDHDPPLDIRFLRSFMDRNLLPLSNEDDFHQAENEIRDYLNGSVLESVSDDKTIVGIINTDITPLEKEQSYYEFPNIEMIKLERQKALYPEIISKEE